MVRVQSVTNSIPSTCLYSCVNLAREQRESSIYPEPKVVTVKYKKKVAVQQDGLREASQFSDENIVSCLSAVRQCYSSLGTTPWLLISLS